MFHMIEHDIQRAIFLRFRSNSLALIPNCYALGHEADVLRVMRSRYTHEYEIKRTMGDYRADARKRRWRSHAPGPNRYTYVLASNVAERVDVPEWAGLIVAHAPTDRTPHIRLSLRRAAPLRHSGPMSAAALQRALLSCMYRLWSVRASRVEQPVPQEELE